MKNYGLKLSVPKGEDYIFGSSLPIKQINLSGDWTNYLPSREFQDTGGFEPYACVSYALLNCVETLIKFKYGEEVNYSDRFMASVSGTEEGGNDPQIVCEFLRKIGVVKEDIWSMTGITSFDEYYKALPPKLYELAQEFNTRWDFKHEYVPSDPNAIAKALTCSPLLVSVPAWFLNSNGRYYRPFGMQDNHATTLFYESDDNFRRVFDTYDSPCIKDLEWDVIPMVVKRFTIEKKVINSLQKPSLGARILAWFKKTYNL